MSGRWACDQLYLPAHHRGVCSSVKHHVEKASVKKHPNRKQEAQREKKRKLLDPFLCTNMFATFSRNLGWDLAGVHTPNRPDRACWQKRLQNGEKVFQCKKKEKFGDLGRSFLLFLIVLDLKRFKVLSGLAICFFCPDSKGAQDEKVRKDISLVGFPFWFNFSSMQKHELLWKLKPFIHFTIWGACWGSLCNSAEGQSRGPQGPTFRSGICAELFGQKQFPATRLLASFSQFSRWKTWSLLLFWNLKTAKQSKKQS